MKKFKKTYIEITNVCNLSCDFCPKTKRHAEFIKEDLFIKILTELKGHSEYIYFHVMGEPLLHPDLGRFLDISHDYGYRVNLTTNGTLIDKAMDTLLSKPALRQVNFSLHSFEANTSIHSIDSYLDKILNFIREAKKKSGILICLRLWNLQEEVGSEGNMHILRRIEEEFSLTSTIESKITPVRGVKLGENIFLNQSASFQWPSMEADEIEGKGFCYGLRDQIAILVDGTVVPCCLDNEGIIKLGNIKVNSFSEIIESQRAKAIYEGYSAREVIEPLCRKCGYRKRFNL